MHADNLGERHMVHRLMKTKSAKSAVFRRRYRAKVEKPKKGKGSYQRRYRNGGQG